MGIVWLVLKVQTYVDGATPLLYALEKHHGADALLVGFPKLRPGILKPPLGLRPYVASIPAHRLYLGSDANQFVGPRRELRGARSALSLVEDLTRKLRVPRERVVFYGSSYGGVIACVLGLQFGGVVLAGAPPIAMGSAVYRWAQTERVGRKAGSAESFVALGAGDDDLASIDWLDTLVSRLAVVAERPVRIRFVTGAEDYGYESTLAFVEQARALPVVDATVDQEGDRKHAEVAGRFWGLVPSLIAAELGLG